MIILRRCRREFGFEEKTGSLAGTKASGIADWKMDDTNTKD